MKITFTIARPLSLNRMYAPIRTGGAGRKMRITADGRAFKLRIVGAGLEARVRSRWPTNLWRIRKAELSYQLYDYAGDVDGPRKAVRDALERILYVNDRLVQDGPAPLPIKDGGGARMVVTVEILELVDDAAAIALRTKAEKGRTQRLASKRRKTRLAFANVLETKKTSS